MDGGGAPCLAPAFALLLRHSRFTTGRGAAGIAAHPRQRGGGAPRPALRDWPAVDGGDGGSDHEQTCDGERTVCSFATAGLRPSSGS